MCARVLIKAFIVSYHNFLGRPFVVSSQYRLWWNGVGMGKVQETQ